MGIKKFLSFILISFAMSGLLMWNASAQDYFNPYEVLMLPAPPSVLNDEQVQNAFQTEMQIADLNRDTQLKDEIIDAYNALKTTRRRAEFSEKTPTLKTVLDQIPLLQPLEDFDWGYKHLSLTIDDLRSNHPPEVIPLFNELQKLWKSMSYARKLYTLKQASGERLELILINLIIGLNPSNLDSRRKMRELFLARFDGDSMAFSNFIYFAASKALKSIVNYDVSILTRHEKVKSIRPKADAIEYMSRMLADQGDYWSYRTLLDLELDHKSPMGYDNGLAIERIEAIRKEPFKRLGIVSDFLWLTRAVVVAPPRFIYKYACSKLIEPENYRYRKAPF